MFWKISKHLYWQPQVKKDNIFHSCFCRTVFIFVRLFNYHNRWFLATLQEWWNNNSSLKSTMADESVKTSLNNQLLFLRVGRTQLMLTEYFLNPMILSILVVMYFVLQRTTHLTVAKYSVSHTVHPFTPMMCFC